jgi:type IV fimbrial biogenesis protein FimT
MPYQTAHRPTGFTLVELMVTIAVAALLVSIAAPSFRDMSVRNRLSTYTSDLIASINFARSEAVHRGSSVSICHSEDGATCSGGWNDGWLTFADPNGDGARDDDEDAHETVLKFHESLATTYTVGTDDAIEDAITFKADGSASATGIFAFCHSGTTTGARAVIITPLRPRVARDSDDNRIPNRDDGADIASCDSPSGT